MAPFIVLLITSPNISRFLKFFHHQNQETICNETHYRSHYTSIVSLHYLMKCQMTIPATPLTVAWSTLIEPGMWPPNNPDLNPVDYAVRDALQEMAYQCWRFTTVNQLQKAIVTEWGKVPQRMVDCTIGQWRHRLWCVIQHQGGHIENFMWKL